MFLSIIQKWVLRPWICRKFTAAEFGKAPFNSSLVAFREDVVSHAPTHSGSLSFCRNGFIPFFFPHISPGRALKRHYSHYSLVNFAINWPRVGIWWCRDHREGRSTLSSKSRLRAGPGECNKMVCIDDYGNSVHDPQRDTWRCAVAGLNTHTCHFLGPHTHSDGQKYCSELKITDKNGIASTSKNMPCSFKEQ